MSQPNTYQWLRHPAAENLLLEFVADLSPKSAILAQLSEETRKASTALFSWIDFIVIRENERIKDQLIQNGFEESAGEKDLYSHPGALLPAVRFGDIPGLALRVDSIEDFVMTHRLSLPIEGSACGRFRQCRLNTEEGAEILIVERRQNLLFTPEELDPGKRIKYVDCLYRWQTRPRDARAEIEQIEAAIKLAQEFVDDLGPELAANAVLEAERKYWQSRNRAGWTQKARQDQFGLGWANYDHHTYRSSRKHYPALVKIFETLGFACREKFYAGEEAGWGAQVMEHPGTGHMLFLDVDLAPGEIDFDIAHSELPELAQLGTVGLWCALHGDSILSAGLHHLAIHVEFEKMITDLQEYGIKTMAPFSEFDYLKQAFTEGEMWAVDGQRLKKLVEENYIGQNEADKFAAHGARGSHLELIQRSEGFKGFNQHNVSDIITRTDPRKAD